MRRNRNVKVTPSTGNVFRDLGLSTEESEQLLARADLLLHVQKVLAARRLTQAAAAKLLHVTQPRVSDLLRGRIDLFSTDSLIDMLARLGVRVSFVVKPALRGQAVRMIVQSGVRG
jgi:predicted XRE-type DNA-binding protein